MTARLHPKRRGFPRRFFLRGGSNPHARRYLAHPLQAALPRFARRRLVMLALRRRKPGKPCRLCRRLFHVCGTGPEKL